MTMLAYVIKVSYLCWDLVKTMYKILTKFGTQKIFTCRERENTYTISG